MKNNKVAGLSLVELMVVIAMIGILAAIALPSYNKLVQSERLTASANRLQSGFKFARSEAIKRGETVAMSVQNDLSIKVLAADLTELRLIAAPDTGVTIEGLADMVISPLGTTTAANILLANSDRDLRLCILRSGQSLLGGGNCP
ncbi:GspH/FimT family pseudopilin [Shewanella zhuhaiensis]|jgi:type IV fimbrial biogenesis protein FimT|uniref:GspH/FimT family pseudopilin n=1 Tax=Shewanella zhuhaiensis TaxID=2919576 RepID=UPI0023E782D0|nr:GspH/FimT family pseudopilin [Shewanella zhuhaiensis]